MRDSPLPGRNAMLAPGAARIRAAPRLPRRRAMLLVSGFLGTWLLLQILLALPLFLVVGALVGATPMALSESEGAALSITSLSGCALALGLAAGVLAAVAVLRRWCGPSLAALGLRREGMWAREVIVGAALGPLAFAVVVALELAFGWATVERGSVRPGGLLLGALGFTGIAINEEVATRGIVLQVLGRAWNPPVALLVSSALFAALHAPNPNASPPAIALLVVAGLALAWGYLATGRLWLPIAFHWSWNFAQGPLFGFPVSGLAGDGLLAVTPVGPDWATGGGFGPEAGLVGLVGEFIAAAVILGWRRAGGSTTATTAAAAAGLAGMALLLVVRH